VEQDASLSRTCKRLEASYICGQRQSHWGRAQCTALTLRMSWPSLFACPAGRSTIPFTASSPRRRTSRSAACLYTDQAVKVHSALNDSVLTFESCQRGTDHFDQCSDFRIKTLKSLKTGFLKCPVTSLNLFAISRGRCKREGTSQIDSV